MPSLHAWYTQFACSMKVLNLLVSSWQMRLQLGLWIEFVENANGWRLFVPEMGTPCQHGAAVDLWEGRQERERREGIKGGEVWGRGCGRVHERGMYTAHATGGERGRTA